MAMVDPAGGYAPPKNGKIVNDFPTVNGGASANLAPTPAGANDSGQAGAPQAPWWITKDYWAPDREQVLNDPTRWGSDPNAPKPAAAAAPAGGMDPNAFRDAWYASGGKNVTDLAAFVKAHPEYGATITGSKGSKVQFGNGQAYQAVRSAGIGGGIGAAWDDLSQAQQQGVFSDPATSQWEQLIRTLTDRLNQPQPSYTPAQMDLMQTQAIDPLERQRQAMKQKITQHYAALGHGQNSGPLQQALQDVDRQFTQLETQQRAGFATNQINREDQLFANNENRAVAAANLFKQIPLYGDTRLGLAQSTLMPNNPAQLLGSLASFQNNAYNQSYLTSQQNQQFWNQIAQALSSLWQ